MNNFTNGSETRPQYENVSIPQWGFNSSCDWRTAATVDLAISSIATFYNLVVAFLPLRVSRMYSMQGAVISSHTWAAFLVSLYCAFFDSRFLNSEQEVRGERYIPYVLIWFLSYHCVFHMHLLSWNQHHSVTRFNAHNRFASRSKLIQIELVVWTSSIALTLLEVFFTYDPLNYPDSQLASVSKLRLIVILISMAFCWFGPLVLVVTWNVIIFSFLLKVIHHGYEKKKPPEPETPERDLSEAARNLEPWNTLGGVETFYEDPPEYATLPDDVEHQLQQSFVNFISVTTFATTMIIWTGFHVLAIFRTGGEVMKYYHLYEVIYNCKLYICVYTVAKFLLLCNPLWIFYYRREMRVCATLKKRHGVPQE
ncbi:uncharacterized protein LOC114516064 [Dendronephthya gigantea]|uniref:uncharacterized protein LOC114516064 n=1 Tax=Dendronephthya gigantea TaxID=151771 RepID=UPI00106AAABC|nr:uncharacterized protein LOC114516064 [Dendronephthya gigantea]